MARGKRPARVGRCTCCQMLVFRRGEQGQEIIRQGTPSKWRRHHYDESKPYELVPEPYEPEPPRRAETYEYRYWHDHVPAAVRPRP